MKTNIWTLSLGSALLALGACNGGGSAKDLSQLVRPLADDVVIAEYTGGKVTAKDLNSRLVPMIKETQGQITDAYIEGAEQAVLMKVLEAEAKKQNLSGIEELMNKVSQDGGAPVAVTDQQVTEFMKQNGMEKGTYTDPRSGEKRKVTKEEIKQFLTQSGAQNSMRQKQQAYIQGLRETAKIKVLLSKPKLNVVATGKEPFLGGENAKVVVYEFSDFQCPFCSRGHGIVKDLNAKYGDKVKVVFRHLPIESKHPEARPAAIAAMCAHEQGKFWVLHDKIFEHQNEMSSANYMKWGQEAGLDMAKYTECVTTKKTNSLIDADLKAAEEMGVGSTPTFIVNGRLVQGGARDDVVKAYVEEELNAR